MIKGSPACCKISEAAGEVPGEIEGSTSVEGTEEEGAGAETEGEGSEEASIEIEETPEVTEEAPAESTEAPAIQPETEESTEIPTETN